METPRERSSRLVVALEEIVASETVILRARDFAALFPLQAKAGAIIADLTRDAAAASDETRAKIRSILQHRQQTRTWLIAEMSSVTRQLESLDSTRARLNRLKPVYTQADPAASERLRFVA